MEKNWEEEVKSSEEGGGDIVATQRRKNWHENNMKEHSQRQTFRMPNTGVRFSSPYVTTHSISWKRLTYEFEF